ncbi:unnamed protein product [Prorocentrum cordatum]|uniref:Glycosyltransferase 2-like domain-containing protein n=1 Tax=Prorocentrum cordatum TaxID=2364126 RepID=A0ABN9VEH8_9DINO|nr:unnamed protein product [Polarella glacialis]
MPASSDVRRALGPASPSEAAASKDAEEVLEPAAEACPWTKDCAATAAAGLSLPPPRPSPPQPAELSVPPPPSPQSQRRQTAPSPPRPARPRPDSATHHQMCSQSGMFCGIASAVIVLVLEPRLYINFVLSGGWSVLHVASISALPSSEEPRPSQPALPQSLQEQTTPPRPSFPQALSQRVWKRSATRRRVTVTTRRRDTPRHHPSSFHQLPSARPGLSQPFQKQAEESESGHRVAAGHSRESSWQVVKTDWKVLNLSAQAGQLVLNAIPPDLERQPEPRARVYHLWPQDSKHQVQPVEYSLIVNMHNRYHNVMSVLGSYFVSSRGSFELLCFCDGCNAKTLRLAERAFDTYLPIVWSESSDACSLDVLKSITGHIFERGASQKAFPQYWMPVREMCVANCSDAFLRRCGSLRRAVLVDQTPAVFETASNNRGALLADGKFLIIMQDDWVMTQIGWNVHLSLPARLYDDVFCVSSRCAEGKPAAKVGRCNARERRAPVSPELLAKSGTFFVRPSGDRGPLLYNASKFRRMGYVEEQEESQTRVFSEVRAVFSGRRWTLALAREARQERRRSHHRGGAQRRPKKSDRTSSSLYLCSFFLFLRYNELKFMMGGDDGAFHRAAVRTQGWVCGYVPLQFIFIAPGTSLGVTGFKTDGDNGFKTKEAEDEYKKWRRTLASAGRFRAPATGWLRKFRNRTMDSYFGGERSLSLSRRSFDACS